MKKLKLSDINIVLRLKWVCPECGEECISVAIQEELYCRECDEWIEVEGGNDG